MTSPYGLMADLHLHDWSAFATTTADGQNSRLVGLLGEISRCAHEVMAAGGSTVILAGDVFHVRGSVKPSVGNAIKDLLTHLVTKLSVSFYIMPGNHDLEGKDSTRLSSAVTALEGTGIRIENEACVIGNVAMIPWVESIDELKKQIKGMAVSIGKCSEADLILHAPIDGVIPGLPTHGLTAEFLADLGFKRVFAGHYHNHKKMHNGADLGTYKTGDVYSIGALAHHSWSDIGTKAGYLLVYRDRVDWRKSHLPEFVDLSQLVDVEPDELPFLVDGNYVRVKVEASKVKDVEAARQELLDMGARAVIVQAQPKPPVREGATGVVPTVATGASLEVSVSDFINAMYRSVGIEDISDAVTKAAFDVLASCDTVGD